MKENHSIDATQPWDGRDVVGRSSFRLSFNRAVEMPTFPEGGEEWYHWAIENWGTKWDLNFQMPYEVELRELSPLARALTNEPSANRVKVELNFLTANSPPSKWFKSVVPKYPRLDFQLLCGEEGSDFSAEYRGFGGELQYEEVGDYGDYFGTRDSDEDDDSDDDDKDDKQKAKDNIHEISNLVTECEDIKSGTILEIQNLLKKLYDYVDN